MAVETAAAPRRATPRFRAFLADTLTPVAAYRRLAPLSPQRFLFESVTGGEQVSRFSFLGAGASDLLYLHEDRVIQERDGRRRVLPGPPLEALRRELGRVVAAPHPIPFTGGYVGFFGYDLVRLVERLPQRPPDPFGLPLALLARFDALVVFDHAHQRVLGVANTIEGEVDEAEAEARLDRIGALLTADQGGGGVVLPEQPVDPPAEAAPSLSGDDFRRAVARAKEHIVAGDVYQVVLARRWSLPAPAPPLALYRALRLVNPSPYMVLIEFPEVALVGASPEMLVRAKGRRVETRPIAGTRHRSEAAEEDRRLATELLADPKERAEHVMLVDLGRNDLGRVSVPGSVSVERFMEVERYSHVMHLVSNVAGELAPERDAMDALLACFPAGTVSGAPKVRAMQIIDDLEPEGRGPYAGAVGYLSFTGDMDTCITIRTVVVRGGEASVTAGAGIVADSDPAREERETESKAAAMLAAAALARRLEERA